MHLLFLTWLIAATAATGEKCRTPSGQKGECVPLAECKSLLWSFANPKEGTVEYLKQFECVKSRVNGIFVCCHITTDYLVFEDDEDNWDSNSIHNIKHLTNAKDCGIQQNSVNENGILHINDFPWMVKLEISDADYTYEQVGCTGVLLNRRHVLITAQCYNTAVDYETFYYVRVDYYTGKDNNCKKLYDSYTTRCSNYQSFEVEDLILHPFYDPVTKLNDLAILRLNRLVDVPGFTSRGKTPKVHTRVQNYLQWIKGALGRERCLTPSNEAGFCILLSDCPRLMDAFANAGPKDEEYLKKFVCKSPADVIEGQIESQTITVCCGNTPNFNISITSTNTDMYKLSNSGYCGLQHRDDYLSFDETLSVDEFPWLVAVINGTVPSKRIAVCAGTLITDRYVVTSADCANFGNDDIMLIRLGDYNLKNEVDCLKVPGFNDYDCNDVQEYEVEERKIHPFYNEMQKINDIALLRMKQKVEFTDYVRPICLPRTENDITQLGKVYYMTGFGSNGSKTDGPRIKKKIFTYLISPDICNEYWKEYNYATPSTDYEICMGLFKNSTDAACVGDEGGPVMLSKRSQWYIVGIASTFGCRSGEPISHLNVFKYIPWIKLNLKH
ncbi:hypothetical protein FQR65_LT10130 [Abscondita terminalis]|nr:hypothetical protein FQR65_LT10130 [Abscondita terminalis]